MNIDDGMVLVKKQNTLHTEKGKTECLLGVPVSQPGVKGKPGTDWPVTTDSADTGSGWPSEICLHHL